MLSRSARAVIDTALQKYRPGRTEPILVCGITSLKPALRLMTIRELFFFFLCQFWQLFKTLREFPLCAWIRKGGSKYDSKRSGAWIKIKLYQQGSFVIGGYTQPAGERKHMGALLVGVYENGKLKFAGRVGTGFSEKLLKALSVELNKIAVKSCPFYNLPATGRGLDPGLTVAEMKRCIWVKPAWFARSNSRSGRGMIDCDNRFFSGFGKIKLRVK